MKKILNLLSGLMLCSVASSSIVACSQKKTINLTFLLGGQTFQNNENVAQITATAKYQIMNTIFKTEKPNIDNLAIHNTPANIAVVEANFWTSNLFNISIPKTISTTMFDTDTTITFTIKFNTDLTSDFNIYKKILDDFWRIQIQGEQGTIYKLDFNHDYYIDSTIKSSGSTSAESHYSKNIKDIKWADVSDKNNTISFDKLGKKINTDLGTTLSRWSWDEIKKTPTPTPPPSPVPFDLNNSGYMYWGLNAIDQSMYYNNGIILPMLAKHNPRISMINAIKDKYISLDSNSGFYKTFLNIDNGTQKINAETQWTNVVKYLSKTQVPDPKVTPPLTTFDWSFGIIYSNTTVKSKTPMGNILFLNKEFKITDIPLI